MCGSEPVVTKTKSAFFSHVKSESGIFHIMLHTHKLTCNLMRSEGLISSTPKLNNIFAPLSTNNEFEVLLVLNGCILSSVKSAFHPMNPALIMALEFMPN